MLLILLSFALFDRSNYWTLAVSIIGTTSLIFNAKGNPFGQVLMIIFSVFYGMISFTCAYYGEMITYLGMTMPMAILALVSWLKHPYKGNQSEVEISGLSPKDWCLLCVLCAAVTVLFYFILNYFHTANMLLSTASIATSFVAAFLTFKRNPFYAIAYAANDVVLIFLWGIASMKDASYIAVLVCFIAFFFNDMYGFVNWRKMEKRQLR